MHFYVIAEQETSYSSDHHCVLTCHHGSMESFQSKYLVATSSRSGLHTCLDQWTVNVMSMICLWCGAGSGSHRSRVVSNWCHFDFFHLQALIPDDDHARPWTFICLLKGPNTSQTVPACGFLQILSTWICEDVPEGRLALAPWNW